MTSFTPFEYSVLVMLAHNGVGLVGNLLALVLWKWDLFASRKLQPGKWPEWRLVRKALVQYVVESYVLFPLMGYFVLTPLLLTRAATELPSLVAGTLQVVAMLLMTDVLFYTIHRVLHWGPLYRRVHRKHHEFTVTTVLSFEYSHPLETVGNIATVTLPPLLLGAHPVLHAVLIALRMWESFDCHCGYDLPLWLSPWQLVRATARHDYHHSKNMGSYGMFAFLDIALGTSAAYDAHLAAKKAKNTAS